MGVKRPLKPQVAAKYGEELAQAEKMAAAGFDESIYGPTNVAFNPLDEMKVLAQNNITDNSFMKASQKEFEQMKNPNMVEDALGAVQAEDPSFPMPQDAPPEETAQEPAGQPQNSPQEEEKQDMLPEDPEEKLKFVAEHLAAINPQAPNATVLREWKRIHGNVFVLQIDDHVFIYRYLKRQEWAQIQANEQFHSLRPDQQEDWITEKCTLWPKFNPHTKGALPAGASSMLAEQIRIQSMFLDPMQVANITIKL